MTISAPTTAPDHANVDSKKPEATQQASSSNKIASSATGSISASVPKLDADADTVSISSAAQTALRQVPPSVPQQQPAPR